MEDESKKDGLGRRQRFGVVFGVGVGNGQAQKVRVQDRDAEIVFSGLSKLPWNFFATWDQPTRTWKWTDVSNGSFLFQFKLRLLHLRAIDQGHTKTLDSSFLSLYAFRRNLKICINTSAWNIRETDYSTAVATFFLWDYSKALPATSLPQILHITGLIVICRIPTSWNSS